MPPQKRTKEKNNGHSEVKCGHLIILMFFYGFLFSELCALTAKNKHIKHSQR